MGGGEKPQVGARVNWAGRRPRRDGWHEKQKWMGANRVGLCCVGPGQTRRPNTRGREHMQVAVSNRRCE